MNPKLLESLPYVIAYLDACMEVSPSKELADTSNYLQKIYDELSAR